MFRNSMGVDMLVYLLIAAVFVAAILLPYPKFGGKDKKNTEDESDKSAQG